jgi:hypothetical protein
MTKTSPRELQVMSFNQWWLQLCEIPLPWAVEISNAVFFQEENVLQIEQYHKSWRYFKDEFLKSK